MAALSAKYHSLTAAEMAKLQQIGEAATASARSGSSASFGSTTRQQARANRKRELEDTPSAGTTTLAVAPKSAKTSLFEKAALSSSESHMLRSVWSRLVSLRQSLRAERQVAIAQSKMLEENAASYDAGPGREAIAKVGEALGGRGLDAWEPSLHCRPKPATETTRIDMIWKPTGLIERVAVAMRLRRKSVAGQKFFKACGAVWDNICKTFQYQRVPHVDSLRRAPVASSLCHVAGMCVCTPRGSLLQRFARRLDVAVKQHFGAKAQADVRAKLGRGEVALLFVGQTKQQWEEACNLGVPGNVAAFTCFQVSVHSYSPWLSTYQSCDLDACNEELATPPMALELNLSTSFSKHFSCWMSSTYSCGGG